MGKTWQGNSEPKNGWLAFGERCEFEEVNWVILYRLHEKGFLNLKIAADGRAKNKANYWFSFKIAEGSFFGRDFSVMRANRPELCELIESKINDILELSKIREVANDAA
jgi:hypothetical protein